MSKPPVKGRADYFAPGDWNIHCAFCGRKRKASECKKLPVGDPLGGDQWVCPEHWRSRQPQDFVRGIPENMSAPFVQRIPDAYITNFCDLFGRSSYADYAVADCAVCDLTPDLSLTDADFALALDEDEDTDILTDDTATEIIP